MSESIKTIIQWHEQTFPDATLEGQEQKWEDERDEWENTSYGSKYELEELADMVIVCCGVMRFDYAEGFDYLAATLCKISVMAFNGTDLWRAVEKKMAKNRKRVFIHSGQGHYQHKAGIED